MDPKQQATIPEEIRVYLESILEQADVLILDEKDEEEILADMYGQLTQFLIGKVLQLLPADQVDAFADLEEDKKSAEEVQKFIEEHVPNSKDELAKAFDEFSNLYLETIAIEEARLAAVDDASSQKSQSTADMLKNIAAGELPKP